MMFLNEKITNRQLLDLPTHNENKALDFTSAITVNRPFRTKEEASMAANNVNTILAFVAYGVQGDAVSPNEWEQVFNGRETILTACRLVSLPVEQYIDQLPDEVR